MKMKLATIAIFLLAFSFSAAAQKDVSDKSQEAIAEMKVDLARLEAMPQIVAEMVRPAEKIDSIKIHQIGGLTGGVGTGPGGDGAGKPVVNQALDSILGMAVQMPALKKLGEELGVSLEDGLVGVTGAIEPDRPAKPGPAAQVEHVEPVGQTPTAAE